MTGDIPWYQRADFWNHYGDPLNEWDNSWNDNSWNPTIKYVTTTDYKFKEDVTFHEVMEYINSTYEQHYSEKGGVQALDFIMANADSLDFLKGNAIKYLARYGKKEGMNKKDLFKAIHYIILLHYFSENNPNE
jgi:hypothetical protein